MLRTVHTFIDLQRKEHNRNSNKKPVSPSISHTITLKYPLNPHFLNFPAMR